MNRANYHSQILKVKDGSVDSRTERKVGDLILRELELLIEEEITFTAS